MTTGDLVDLFCRKWGDGAKWESKAEANAVHEANFLKLDCSKLKSVFGWKPKWHIEECIEKTCDFSKAWLNGENIKEKMDEEIKEFMAK